MYRLLQQQIARGNVLGILLTRTVILICAVGLHVPSSLAATLKADRTYEGSAVDGIQTFLGIPFAQADRWQAPRPLSPKNNEALPVQANQFPPACMQTDHIVRWYRNLIDDFGGDPDSFQAPEMAEECLYLNIWAPEQSHEQPLPVVIYIHGGSNKGGWSYEPNYIGAELAKRGLIVISINYRLGIFGFFAHPDIPDPNFALLDQIAALQWIHRHIGQLGGDRSNITLMGESAGASNIDFLLAAPAARGLFHRAIHQSAGWAITGRVNLEDARTAARKLAASVGQGSEATLTRLKTENAQIVMTQAAKLYESIYFDPIAGTPSLPVSVSDQFTEGTVHKVELLIGSNADEWLIYLDESHSFEDDLNELAPPEQHEAIRQALAGLPERKARDILISAANYVCPSFRIAETMTLLDRQVWFYYFDQVRTGELASTMGAYHGAELPYVFDTHDDWLPTTAADRALTDVMMSYWSNFIKTGDPNAPGLPRWAPYDGESQLTLRLNTKAASQAHPSASICAALDM